MIGVKKNKTKSKEREKCYLKVVDNFEKELDKEKDSLITFFTKGQN